MKREMRTVRQRIRPGTRSKANALLRLAGACRFVWNDAVARLNADYENTGGCNHRFKSTENDQGQPGLGRAFIMLRHAAETAWLKEMSCDIIRASLQPIEIAYREFFKGTYILNSTTHDNRLIVLTNVADRHLGKSR